jgi:hypothetical protein
MKHFKILFITYVILISLLCNALTLKSLGGEFQFDPNPVYIPTTGNQSKADVAFDGTNFLVVWQDLRNYPSDVYAARVTKDGLVLDVGGIPICTAAGSQISPRVAYNGKNYLIVWEDWRNGNEPDIYGTRVSTYGVVLDSGDIVISKLGGNQATPSVAFDGTNFLVVWGDTRTGSYDIYGARVDSSGTVLDTNGIVINKSRHWQTYPDLEFDGTNYLVVWQDHRYFPNPDDIYGARVSPLGVVLDSAGFVISSAGETQDQPKIAFDGVNYFVIWGDARKGSWDYDIYGAMVNTAGSVLDTDGIPICSEPDTIYGRNHDMHSIAFDGNNYLIVYRFTYETHFEEIFGTRVSTAGDVLDPTGVLMCQVSAIPDLYDLYPAVAFGNSHYLIAWEHHLCSSTECYDIYGVRVTPGLDILDVNGIFISQTGYDFFEQRSPSAAFDGTNYLVVWEDFRTSKSDIYGAIVRSSPINPNPTLIAISTVTSSQNYPDVAFGDSIYLVVWQDDRDDKSDIYGARIKQNGEILDPYGFQISATDFGQEFPKVAFDGTNFLVVWTDARNIPNRDIYAARVTQDGNVLDPNGIEVYTGTNSSPEVAFDGNNYLIVWENDYSEIYGSLINTSGTVLEPGGLQISEMASYVHAHSPNIAFDGTNYLVIWSDSRNGNDDIYCARVTPSGTVLDSTDIPISTATNDQQYASIVFDGTNYQAAWDDYRNNSDTADVYCAKISTTGSVIQEIPLVIGEGNQYYTSLAHGTGSQVLLAYNGWIGEYQELTIDVNRALGKFIGEPSGIRENSDEIPAKFILYQNYPNPFNPLTTIRFELPKESHVTLKVYNMLGQEVAILVNEKREAGRYQVEFNASCYSNGVYFYRLQTCDYIETKKLLLIK